MGFKLTHADWVVPTHENDKGHECLPRYFDDDVGQHESLPRVSLCRALSHFVQSTLRHKVRHDLLHKLTKDGEKHEDGEHLILETLLTERRLVEDETDEECLVGVSKLRSGHLGGSKTYGTET